MRIAIPIGLAAAAVLVGASLAPSSATVIVRPNTRTQISHLRDLSKFHAVAIPRGNALIGHAVYNGKHSWVHKNEGKAVGCIYVSFNLSGVTNIYSSVSPYTQTGSLTSSSLYGWGAASTPLVEGNKSLGTTYLGTYADTIDFYTSCTGTSPSGSVTGVSGDYPYGMTVAPTGSLYATAWPSSTIQYWTAPVTSGEAVTTATEPNITEAYFIDVDNSNAYVAGYNSSSVETVDACSTTITGCASVISISGGFPGGVQTDGAGNVYINNQYGTMYSYSGCPSACTASGSFTYSNGTNPLDYTAMVLGVIQQHIWGANIYYCSSSYGLCGDGSRQSVPLASALLDGNTPGVSNDEALGISFVRGDSV